ncbi:MAG: DoxX family membrane protein [bacterium]|nr:DoxX family membrane protein [bacterium]
MKINEPHAFAKIIHNYQILPDFFIYIPVLLMPWVEILTGLLLITGFFKRTSAILLSTMLLIFIVAISYNLMRGLNFDCGCFSVVPEKGGSDPVGLLIRDLLLLIPAAVIIFFEPKKIKDASGGPSGGKLSRDKLVAKV